MHPSVRLPDANAKCPICFMDLIPVSDSTDNRNPNQLTLSESAKLISQIETTKVAQFFPTANVRLFGKLVYDETSVSRISAYFPGRINRLFVNYVGVPVQQGDHLAEMYSPELIAAFAELEHARTAFDNSESASDFLRKSAEQTLDASKEKLRLFGLTQDQIAQIESGSFDKDELTIYSPIGGVVTHLAAREGDYFDTGDPIATVANLSQLWLDLEAYESQLPMLRWGVPITFTVEAHPGEVFEGRISFIEPIVDDRTRTAAVRVAVDNTDHKLKPGMFVSAVARPKIAADGVILSDELAGQWVSPMHPTIVKDHAGNCDVCGMDLVPAESLGIVGDPSKSPMPLIIPRSAVLFTGTRSIVYIQVPNADQPTYEARTVQLGPLAGEFYTIRSGLNIDDDVVTNGAFRIDSSMQIQAKPSMMSPPRIRSKPIHPHSFLVQLEPIYTAYLNAQERLADDDFSGFIEHALQLNSFVTSATPTNLTDDQLKLWNQSSAMLKADPKITTIDQARAHFEDMSKGVMDLEQTFGHREDEIWNIAFCPMAFDFKGASWIQRGVTINNPYFGEQMLLCGSIEQTLEPTNQAHQGHNNE